MAEEHSLPGWPKKKLVKEVRRHLSVYGFRPVKQAAWQAAWAWADKIAHSYFHVHWPLPSEIGTQYILLLLAEMQDSHCLRLPYQAREIMPPEVAALLPAMQQQGFPAIEVGVARARGRRKPIAMQKEDSSQPSLFPDE
jgi:cation transport regulator ChaB